jgi:hypothetical protein
MQSTKLAVPVPPPCVLAYASATEQLAIERANDRRKQELLAEAIAPVLQRLIDANGLYTLAGAIELVLGREVNAAGQPMKCVVSLRPKHEAQGWF